MNDQPNAVPTDKPQGFGKWLGRGLGVVLILLALGALLFGLGGGNSTNEQPVESSNPFK